MMTGYLLITLRSQLIRSMVAEEVKVTGVVVTLMKLSPPVGGERRRMDFLVRSKYPNFRGKKGHPHDVADAFRQWVHCITYYCDYYEDSYLIPLVVSSLTGDTSGVFDWTCSISPEGAQDLSTLLQMLREHYCGSYTFQEQ